MQVDTNRRHPVGLHAMCATGLLALACAVVGCGGGNDVDLEVPAPTSVAPLALPGPYPIACSNVAQDFARMAPGGEEARAHWEGRPAADGTPRYVSELLTDPVNALSVTVNTPNDGNLYGSFAGKPVGFAVLVCYPTTADNPRPDFPLPTGQRVPRMQTGAEAPLFADSASALSGHCLFARPGRQPAVRRPLRRAVVAGQPWLCRGGAVSR